jgi:hypothetical protein
MVYTVKNIQYDIDGENPNDLWLPNRLDVDVPNNIEDDEVQDYLSDEISNRTGFCHFGFTYELKK